MAPRLHVRGFGPSSYVFGANADLAHHGPTRNREKPRQARRDAALLESYAGVGQGCWAGIGLGSWCTVEASAWQFLCIGVFFAGVLHAKSLAILGQDWDLEFWTIP